MRAPTPQLVNTPSPSGKYANFAAYVDHCVSLVGTNYALGKLVGFTTGTRISDWRKAQGGRPALTACLRLAKLTRDDPFDIMVMAGYAEEADLMREMCAETHPNASLAEMMQPLESIDSAIGRLQYVRTKLEELIK